MGRFGSEPRSRPERNRTERHLRVWVRVMTQTGPTVPFMVQAIREIFRTLSERV